MRKAVDAIVHDPENADQHILLVGHGASVHAALLALNPKAKHKGAYYCRCARAMSAASAAVRGSRRGSNYFLCAARRRMPCARSLTQTVRRQEPDAHGSYYDVRSLWSTEHLDHLRR